MKFSFNQVCGFSDSITLTFRFVKQEWKSLLKSFVWIVLPLVLVDLFLKNASTRDMFAMMVYSSDTDLSPQMLMNNLLGYCSSILLYAWITWMGIAYIRVYQNKCAAGNGESVKPGEVWQVMWQHLGSVFLWWILYFLIVCLGVILLLIPGIYLAVIFFLTVYYMMLKDRSLGEAMSDSRSLIKGKWWHFFAYMIVLQLIVGILSYVFAIPYQVITFKTMFVQELPGMYELTLCLLFSSLGQSLMQLIFVVGIAVRFYSFLEEKEHTGLLEKIEQIGNNDQPVADREENH